MDKLKRLDWNKWRTNALVFLAPLFVLYLVNVQAGISKDGFQMEDFALNEKLVGAMILYVINVLLDFFKKFSKA